MWIAAVVLALPVRGNLVSRTTCAPFILDAAVAAAAKGLILQFAEVGRREALELMLGSEGPVPLHCIPGLKPKAAPRAKKGAPEPIEPFDPFDSPETWARLDGMRDHCSEIANALRNHTKVDPLKLAVLLNDEDYELYDLAFLKETPQAIPKRFVSPYRLNNVVNAILLLSRLQTSPLPRLRRAMEIQIRDDTNLFVRDQATRLRNVIDFLFAKSAQNHPLLKMLAESSLSDPVRALIFVLNSVEMNYRLRATKEPEPAVTDI